MSLLWNFFDISVEDILNKPGWGNLELDDSMGSDEEEKELKGRSLADKRRRHLRQLEEIKQE